MAEREKEGVAHLQMLLDYGILASEDEPYIENVLNLIEKYEKVIDEIKSKLEQHIKFCEQEAKGHFNNEKCHISLKFEKNLLNIINGKVEKDE